MIRPPIGPIGPHDPRVPYWLDEPELLTEELRTQDNRAARSSDPETLRSSFPKDASTHSGRGFAERGVCLSHQSSAPHCSAEPPLSGPDKPPSYKGPGQGSAGEK